MFMTCATHPSFPRLEGRRIHLRQRNPELKCVSTVWPLGSDLSRQSLSLGLVRVKSSAWAVGLPEELSCQSQICHQNPFTFFSSHWKVRQVPCAEPSTAHWLKPAGGADDAFPLWWEPDAHVFTHRLMPHMHMPHAYTMCTACIYKHITTYSHVNVYIFLSTHIVTMLVYSMYLYHIHVCHIYGMCYIYTYTYIYYTHVHSTCLLHVLYHSTHICYIHTCI